MYGISFELTDAEGSVVWKYGNVVLDVSIVEISRLLPATSSTSATK